MQFLSTLAVPALIMGTMAAPIQKRESVTDVVSIVTSLKTEITGHLQTINSTLASITVGSVVDYADSSVVSEIESELSDITTIITSATSDVEDLLSVSDTLGSASSIVRRLVPNVDSLTGGVTGAVEKVAAAPVSTVEGAAGGIVRRDIVPEVEGVASGAVKTVEGVTGGIVRRIVDGIVPEVEGLASGAINTVEGLAGGIVRRVIGSIVPVVEDAATGAISTVEGVAGGVVRREIDTDEVISIVTALVVEIAATLGPVLKSVPLVSLETRVSELASSVEGLVGSLDSIASGLTSTIENLIPEAF